MKLRLLTIMLFIASFSHAQDYMEGAKTNQASLIPAATTYRIYGYIDGKRLDSVDAVYAEFSWFTQDRVTFDFGQHISRVKEYVITDANGVSMIFPTHSYAFLLNFFHYNGWELKIAFGDVGGRTYILEKH